MIAVFESLLWKILVLAVDTLISLLRLIASFWMGWYIRRSISADWSQPTSYSAVGFPDIISNNKLQHKLPSVEFHLLFYFKIRNVVSKTKSESLVFSCFD